MIKEDYVSFETAKLLKEKGFDGCPLFRYDDCGQLWITGGYNKTIKWHFPAPTLQMTMKWLREVHNIFISPRIQNDGTYICYLYDTKGNGIQGYDKNLVQVSYEQACEESIKYCLENLI